MKKLKLFALEPRVLLDAAAAASAIDTHADVANQAADFQQTQQDYLNTNNSKTIEGVDKIIPLGSSPVADTGQAEIAAQWNLMDVQGAAINQVQAHELVVVDTSIANYQVLLEGVSPDAHILYIDPTKDGITQLANAVQGHTDISAIHILSHGKEGTFALGTTILNNQNIEQYKTQLAQIGQSLAENGDILVYGCHLAQGEMGISFVNHLADMTKADVAASNDLTGNAAKGGDWILEYHSGAIEAASLVSNDYSGVLASPVISGTAAGQAVNDNATVTPFAGVTITDADSGNTQTLTVTLSDAAKGTLSNLSGGSFVGGVYTLSGVDAAVAQTAIQGLIFTPTANHVAPTLTETTTFTISVTDNTAANTIDNTTTVIATSINDAPVAVTDPIGIVEKSVNVTGNVLTNDTDVDTGDTKTVLALAGGTLGISRVGTYGSLLLNTDGSYTYTLDNTNTAVQALGAGSAPLTDSFTYTMKDTAGATSSTTLNVSISGINDQPVLTPAPVALTQVEDLSTAFTVGTLLTNASNLPIWTDTDAGTAMGIAITAAPNTDASSAMTGTWKYSLDGSSWVDFPVVSATSALLLPSTAQVQFFFTHDASIDSKNSGSVSLTYTAWDASSGVAGSTGNTTAPTSTSPFSTASNTAVLNVTPFNDAPVFSSSIVTVNEHATVNLSGSFTDIATGSLTGNLRIYDPDNSTAQILYRVEELPTKGTLTLNGAVLAVGSLFSQTNVASIVYTPTVGELSADTTDRFYFTIRDGAGGVIGADGKTGANPWAFIDIAIKDVNAQVAVTGTTIAIAENNLTPNVPVIAPITLSMSDADDPLNLRTLTLTSLPTATFGNLQYWDGTAYVAATTGLIFTQAQLTDAVNPALRFIYNNTTEPTDVNGVLIPAQSQTTFTVHVSDNNPLLLPTTVDSTVTINITPTNDGPVLTIGNNLTVVQGSSGNVITNTLGTGNLLTTDPDSAVSKRTYTVNVDPALGFLTLNGVRIGRGATFTEADLTSGNLKYNTNDPYSNGSDSLQVVVTDGDGGNSGIKTLGITITPTAVLPPTVGGVLDASGNTASITGTFKGISPEGLFLKLDNTMLKDVGTGAATTFFTVTQPAHGKVYLNGVELVYGTTTFTQTDINSSNVIYVHDSSEANGYAFTDTLNITATKGTSTVNQAFTITITPVDDAPTITQTVSSYSTNEIGGLLMEQNADGSNGIATAVFDLSNVTNAKKLSTANFQWNDIDNTQGQLTYIATAINGTIARWDGTQWAAIIHNDFSATDLAAGKIAYFHDPAKDVTAPNNTTMTGSVTVYLIDGATVAAGNVQISPPNITELGTLSVTDGTNTISLAKTAQMRSPDRTVTFIATDVNDAPITSNTSFTVTEFSTGIPAQTNHIQILDTSIVSASDSDTGNSSWTYTLTALPVYGVIQLNGVNMAVNDTFTYAQLAAGNLRYVNAGGIVVTTTLNWTAAQDSFKFKVNDGETISTPKPLDSNESTVSIFLRPTNQPPVVVHTGPASIPEGATLNITSTLLGSENAPNSAGIVAAVDVDNTRVQVQYRITANVGHGILYLGNPATGAVTKQLAVGSAFTLEDIQLGNVWYQHNGTESTPYGNQDFFDYVISDASGMTEPPGKFIINLDATKSINDAPIVTGLTGGATFTEGDTSGSPNVVPILIDSSVVLTDPDLANNNLDFRGGSLELTYATGGSNVTSLFDQLAVKNIGGAGIGISGSTITYNGATIASIDAIKNGQNGAALKINFATSSDALVAIPELQIPAVQALIGAITFAHTEYDNAATGVRTLNYTLIDGGGTASFTQSGVTVTGHDTWTGSAIVTVAPANDRPVITPHTGVGNLPLGIIITEDTPDISIPVLPTYLVSSFTTANNATLPDGTHTGIVDVDTGAVRGIAVTGLANAATGHWEYSTNGTSWTTIANTVSATQALLLLPTDSIRFVPDAKNGGTATISYKAWDKTSGTEHTYVDSTTNNTQTSAFSTATDTAEIMVTSINDAPTISATQPYIWFWEDSGAAVSYPISTFTSTVSDVDTGAVKGIAITNADTTYGTWYYSTNNEATWNLLGTPTANNAVLLADDVNTRIKFVPNANYNGYQPSGLTIRAWDQTTGSNGQTGVDTTTNGGITAFSTATVNVKVDVYAVNDAPTITNNAPLVSGIPTVDAASATENTKIPLTTVFNINDFDLARLEGGLLGVITLNVPQGSFVIDSASGVIITAGTQAAESVLGNGNWGGGSTTLTFKGTLVQLQAALASLNYVAGDNPKTSETITLTFNDGTSYGNDSGLYGVNSAVHVASSSVTVTNIVAVNDAPTLTSPSNVTATEDTQFSFSGANTLSIADVDALNIVSGVDSIVEVALSIPAGTLNLTQGATTIASGGLNTNAVTLRGTVAQLNTALATLKYTPALDANSLNSSAANRTLHLVVSDLGNSEAGVAAATALTVAKDIVIAVTPVNDAPTLVPPTSSSTYTEQNAPVTIGAGVVVTDLIDDTQLFGATVTIGAADFRTGDTLAANVGATGITAVYNAATRTLTLSGVANISDYNTVLQSVTFSNLTNDAPTSGGATTRTITWKATDNNAENGANGRLATNVVTSTINIIPVSDAPAGSNNTVTTNEDTTYIFTTANFGFSDPLDNPADTLNRVLITTLPANGTLKLNGINVVAGDYILATDITANKLTYSPVTNANGAAYTSFTFQVEDTGSIANGGVILDQSPNTLTINVTPLNDAPVLTATASNPSVTENATTGTGTSINPVALFTGASIADIDLSTTAALTSTVFGAGSITVSFTDAYVLGDVLFINGALPAGMSTSATDTGISKALTINFATTTTVAELNSILAAISYKSTSDNPTLNDTDTSRAYQIVVNDGNNNQGSANAGGASALNSNIISGTLSIIRANDAPVVDLNGAVAGTDNAVTWTEGSNAPHTAVAINPNATVADTDNTNMTQLIMQVGGVLDGNNEVLNIGGVNFLLNTTVTNVAAGVFLVSYDSGTGAFTILPTPSSVALASSFQTLIQGITYINNIDNPTAGNRTVNFTITDAGFDNSTAVGGELGSNTPTTTINVVPVNDQPVIGNLSSIPYFENALNLAAAIIDSDGSITLTDIDSPNYNGGSLTVSGLIAAQDTVSLPVSAAAVSGNVQLNGGNVEYYNGSSWVVIGTQSGGVGANFVVSFNASATPTIVQRVIENLTFANSSNNPTLTRTLNLALNDGGTGTVQNATVGVTIKLDNDAPVMTAATLGGTYTEQNPTPLQFISGAISVTDPDSPLNFYINTAAVAGSLTVALDGYQTGDTLSVVAGGSITVAGSTLSYGGTAFATTSGGNGAPLVISFTSATATPAAVQALLAQLAFSNTTNEDPTVNNTDPSRVFTVTLNDGGNTKDLTSSTTALTATLTGTINLTAVNDKPVITPAGAPAAYTENAVATVVDNTVTVTDVDDTQMNGGTISITANFLAGDVLAVINSGNITGSYNSATGVLTLSGIDTKANYQAVLRSLTYLNSTDDPTDNTTKTTRTLTYSLTDANSDAVGAATSIAATKTINITPLQDAPVLTGGGGTLTYTEQASAAVIDATVTVSSDADDTQMSGATITLSAGYTAGDVLNFTPQNGITISSNNVGVLVLTGNATLANYTAALRSITFNSTSDTPTIISNSRTVTWQVRDANSDAAVVASSNTVTSTINILAINDTPTFTALGNTVNFTEVGTAVVLNNAVTVADVDLSPLSGGAGNYSGTTLTLLRNGGTNAEDVFSNTGTLAALTQGGNVTVGVTTIGTVTTNSAGTLVLTFNSSATSALVNSALQQIAYRNNSTTPLASVQINWLFSDQNPNVTGGGSTGGTGQDQGGGGLLTASGSTTINIDRLPTAKPDTNSIAENALNVTGNVMTGATTADDLGDPATTVTGVALGTQASTSGSVNSPIVGSYGSLTLNSTGGYTYTLDNANPLVNKLLTGETLIETYSYTITDANGDTSTTTLKITINGTTDGAPTVVSVDGNSGLTGQADVFEKGLVAPTDNSQTTIGTLTVTAPDGMASVTIGGTTFTVAQLAAFSVGSPSAGINTGEGTLKVTGFSISTGAASAPTAGTLSYTYTLNATQAHTGGAAVTESVDTIALVVTDVTTAANTSTGSLTMRIVDDTPTANADTNSITENVATTTGNVFSAGSGGDVADRLGADVTATPITGVATGTQVSTSGNVNTPVVGTYGSLTLNATGGYTYTLDNSNAAVNALRTGQTLTETYSYTITDADGDTSTTTLKITINGVTDGAPSITPVDGNGAATGQAEVYEKGLVTVADTSETTTGTLTVSAPDGMASVTIDGITFTVAQLATFSVGSPSASINTGEGTLKVTGFTVTSGTASAPTAGTLNYSYTLNASQTHTGGAAVRENVDTIALIVTDATTAAIQATGTLSVRIVDDTPTANADVNSIAEDTATTSGNVFLGSTTDVADRLGADVTATPVTAFSFGATNGTLGSPLNGTYGSLTLNANGSYTYTLDNTNPTVNALLNTQSLQETFSYTITDADGNSSTTTLKITINGNTDNIPSIVPNDMNGAITGQVSVRESGLTSGADTSETNTGTLQLSALDGLQSIKVGGTTITLAQLNNLGTTPITVITPKGTITLTGYNSTSNVGGVSTAGTLTYTYTLTQVQNTPAATENTDNIALSITNAGGNTVTNTLSVQIVDDTPTANADVNNVLEGSTTAATTTSGNVFAAGSVGDIADRIGADAVVNPVTGVALGTQASTSGNVNSPVAGLYGSLTLNATGGYTYTLDNTNPTVNALLSGETLLETFSYTITDADGDASTTTLKITINGTTDSIPAISAIDGNNAETGQATVYEKGLVSPSDNSHITTGTLSLSAPDGMASVTIGGATFTVAQLANISTLAAIDTGEGTLKVTGFTITAGSSIAPTFATLSYSYTLKAAQPQMGGMIATESTDIISISVTDSTSVGNTATNTLTIRIVDDAPTANADANRVIEGITAAATTTSGNVFGATGASTNDVADRLGADNTATPVTAVSFGATTVAAGTALVSNYGSLKLNSDGTYTYTLDNTNATVNGLNAGQTLTETFSYTITDADGDRSIATLTITIDGRNDAPVAVNDSIIGESGKPVTINVLGNDSDPENDINPTTVQIVGTANAGDSLDVAGQGTWSVNRTTGAITFTPLASFAESPSPIRYTVQDATGLTSNAAEILATYPDSLLLNATILGGASSYFTAYIGEKYKYTPIKTYDYNFNLSPLYEIKYISYWDSRINPVSLGGTLRDQFVTNGILDYNTGSKFTHTGGESLKFEAGLPNGAPLPDYVDFDEKTGEFKFNAEMAKAQGVDSILIRVGAFDSKGNETSASFQTRFNKDATDDVLKETLHPKLKCDDLKLVLEHQTILEGTGRYSVQNAVQLCNPGEHLKFTVTLEDGSALPNYVKFDSESKIFTFEADGAHKANIKTLVIKVTVKDSHNNVAVGTFNVDFEKLDESSKQPHKDAAPNNLKENQGHVEPAADTAENVSEAQQQNTRGDIFALLSRSEIAHQEGMAGVENNDAHSNVNNTKHSLSEQVKQAGFFGYQQDKGQLLADLTGVFRKS